MNGKEVDTVATSEQRRAAMEIAFEFLTAKWANDDLQTKVSLFSVLYNLFDNEPSLKQLVFENLANYLISQNQASILKSNFENITSLFEQWGTQDKARVFDIAVEGMRQTNDEIALYKMYCAFFQTLDAAESSNYSGLIEDCLKIALQNSKINSYGILIKIPVVASFLSNPSHKSLATLVDIFAYETIEEYQQWASKGEEAIQGFDGTEKMRYLTICTLAQKDNQLTFDQLAKAIKIDRAQIEEWIIEATIEGLIDAKIDQEQEIVVVQNFTRRPRRNVQEEMKEVGESLTKIQKDYDALFKVVRPQ